MQSTTTPNAVSEALVDLLTFPKQLSTISAHVQGQSVGRWVISAVAKHGSFLLGDPVDVEFTHALDYPETRQFIYRVRDLIEDEFIEAWAGIGQAIDWITTDLEPLVEQMAAPGSTVADLEVGVNTASAAFEAAESSIVRLVGLQVHHTETVRELPHHLAQESDQRRAELEHALSGALVGHDSARAQFDHFQTELTIATQEITTAVADMRRVTQQALADVRTVRAALAQLHVDRSQLAAVTGIVVDLTDGAVEQALGTNQRAAQWAAVWAHVQSSLNAKPLLSPLRTEGIRERANRRRD